MSLIYSYTGYQYEIALFGGLCSSPVEAASDWLLSRNLQLNHLVHPPSNECGRGFQTILSDNQKFKVYAEGMIVPKGAAVGIRSGDCPVVTAYNPVAGILACTHSGRAALTPKQKRDDFNVIEPLIKMVAPDQTQRSQVQIFISAAICSSCFQHEQPAAQALIDPFRKSFPEAIVGQYGLDLVKVIRQSCLKHDIEVSNIHHDGLCTKEHPQLASYRNRDTERNLTVVANL